MTDNQTIQPSSERAARTGAEQHSAPKSRFRNFDWASTSAFVGAAFIGAVGVINNVRNSFWQTFILGMGKHPTPFDGIRDQHQVLFTKQATDYNCGTINADQYKANMKDVATQYRNAVADKLLKEFDIPTHGAKGWTVGTWKRLQELSLTGRIQSVVGFASVAAITVGAVNVLRNSRNTIDRIEDKIDAGPHSR